MMRKLLGAACCAVLLWVGSSFGQTQGQVAQPEVEKFRAPMPDVEQLKTWHNGQPLTKKQLKDKVLVVYFWTVEQSMSEDNGKHVAAWAKRYAGKDVVIVPVHKYQFAGRGLQPEEIVDIITEKKIFSAIDLDGKFAEQFRCETTPTVYLVDRGGRIRYRWEGPMDDRRSLHMEPPLRAKIDELLAEPLVGK